MTEDIFSDRAEIRELIAAYALALDAEDIDQCVALFVPDAEFLVYGRAFTGHDGIGQMFRDAPRGLHHTGVSRIDVRGDTATARSQVLFVRAADLHLRPGGCGVAAGVDARETGVVQPAGRVPEHLGDGAVACESPSVDQEFGIRYEQVHALVDVTGIEGQRVGGDHLADRGVVVGHCPVASRRCSAAPRRSACDSAATVIIRNPSFAMVRPVLPSPA